MSDIVTQVSQRTVMSCYTYTTWTRISMTSQSYVIVLSDRGSWITEFPNVIYLHRAELKFTQL